MAHNMKSNAILQLTMRIQLQMVRSQGSSLVFVTEKLNVNGHRPISWDQLLKMISVFLNQIARLNSGLSTKEPQEW